jgi:DNA polymerase-3 subunit alpha
MAFFTVEDRTGEIECIMFAKTYETLGHLARVDNAVFVQGNISVREEEAPKVLVSVAQELVDDEHFTPKKVTAPAAAPADQAQPKSAPKIKKLYLRVPDLEGTPYRKALNLAEIFDEGVTVPLVFYDSASKAYVPHPKGIALSPFVMQQLILLLGKENVIYQ